VDHHYGHLARFIALVLMGMLVRVRVHSSDGDIVRLACFVGRFVVDWRRNGFEWLPYLVS
jgi:hypothetical protein